MQLILTGLLFWFIGWLIEPKNKVYITLKSKLIVFSQVIHKSFL